VIVQSPTAAPCGMACGADGPCCQLRLTSSLVAPGARKRTSKKVVVVRLLPEKVTVTEPPRRTLVESRPRLLMTGKTSASGFTLPQGAFMDVTHVLFSNVFAPAGAKLRMSKPDGPLSGALLATRIGGLPAMRFPRKTLRTAEARIRTPVTFPL